jgi:hypothetical protein
MKKVYISIITIYFIMGSTSRNILAVLLVLTMIISLVGTLAALSSLVSEGYSTVPVGGGQSQSTGKVSVYLPPDETAGRVTVNVLPSEEGG